MHAHCLWREHSSGIPSNPCFKQDRHRTPSLASPALLLLRPGARHLPQSFLSPQAAPLCACTAHHSHGQLWEKVVTRLFKEAPVVSTSFQLAYIVNGSLPGTRSSEQGLSIQKEDHLSYRAFTTI